MLVNRCSDQIAYPCKLRPTELTIFVGKKKHNLLVRCRVAEIAHLGNFADAGLSKYYLFTLINELYSLNMEINPMGIPAHIKEKPTHSEFIALLADKLQLQLKSREVANF